MKSVKFIIFLLILIGSAQIVKADSTPLLRDEVSVLKKKLVAVLDAMGKAPVGYTNKQTDFSLPTEVYPASAGKWEPIGFSVHRESIVPDKTEQISAEYQKKMLEAQQKGDTALMIKLAQEMQTAAVQAQTSGQQKKPIRIDISVNNFASTSIDPDNVLLEQAGLIALKSKDENDSESSQIRIYLDPISLKDTKQLSSIEIKRPKEGVSIKTTIVCFYISISGPTTEVESWGKRIDYAKILALIGNK